MSSRDVSCSYGELWSAIIQGVVYGAMRAIEAIERYTAPTIFPDVVA